MDSDEVTPNRRSSSRKDLAANCGPLSEIILSGRPKHLYKLSRSSLVVPSAVSVLLQESKITPFVRPWSTMTMIESYPCEGGRLVMRSMEHCANGRSEVDPLMSCCFGIVKAFDDFPAQFRILENVLLSFPKEHRFGVEILDIPVGQVILQSARTLFL